MNEDDVVSVIFGNTDDAGMAVEHVFNVLAAVYMAGWKRAIGTAPIVDVKTVWAFQLGHFTHSKNAKRAILWALKNLPDAPPNAIQFRNLCRMAPAAELPALPEPVANPARVAAELGKLEHVRNAPASPHGMKDWAYRLKARHDAGDKLNPNQIRCYQAALGATA